MEVFNYLIEFFSTYGYWAVFGILIACGLGVPVPEDISLIAGGVICALSKSTTHKLYPEFMSIIALFGVLIGDSTMFLMGRGLGSKVTRVRGIKYIITEKVYGQIQAKVSKHGDKVLFLARFLPGLRAPIYIMAGVSHGVSYLKFLIMDGAAALISVPTLVFIGYFFANDLDEILNYVKHSEFVIAGIALVVITIIVVYNIKKSKEHKNKNDN